jgi:hypothetical protein
LTLPAARLARLVGRDRAGAGRVCWCDDGLSSVGWSRVEGLGGPAVRLEWTGDGRPQVEVVPVGLVPRGPVGALWLARCPGCLAPAGALYLAGCSRWRCRSCVPRRYASQYLPTSPRWRSVCRVLGSMGRPGALVEVVVGPAET